jgi:hypothetical protein
MADGQSGNPAAPADVSPNLFDERWHLSCEFRVINK